MNKLNRVMAAVDFSAPARAAFDHALALSRAHDAELTVVHAVPTGRPFRWYAGERTVLLAALRHDADKAGVRVKMSVRQGDPAGEIVLHARALRPDLIVLGTKARTRFERFRLGSVAETVALEATQSVLVVPASVGGKTTEQGAFFNSILVPVDFSAGSTEAVQKALSMASANGRVTVVHVVRGVPLANASRYVYRLMEPEYQRVLARDAWHRLPHVIPADARTSRQVHARVVTGDPSAEISRVANDVDADLIVVGIAPRNAIDRRIFGSTAARLIQRAEYPVLAIPGLTRDRSGPASHRYDQRVAAA